MERQNEVILQNTMDDKIELAIRLKNETRQKFNSWLEDCFQKLDDFYSRRVRESGVAYKFHKPEIDGKGTGSYILAAYINNNGHRIERGILLKWVEVGTSLKVMIKFYSDPNTVNPVWDILLDLYNDFPELQETVPQMLQALKSKYKFEHPIPTPDKKQVDAVKMDGNALLAKEMRIARGAKQLDRRLRAHGFTLFPVEHVNAPRPVDAVGTEKPKQKGRYRLTPKEIKERKKKVKEVEKVKKENPLKTLKEICYELDIPERTFRYWRHENY